jgi:hypothetical protein
MTFPYKAYDPETLSVVGRAFDAAWREFRRTHCEPADRLEATRKMMALRVMAAANDGERDPQRLKQLAIQVADDARASC